MQSGPSNRPAGARPAGPPLRREQVSYVGPVRGGIGSYTAQTKVIVVTTGAFYRYAH
jgi:hypothetical protein